MVNVDFKTLDLLQPTLDYIRHANTSYISCIGMLVPIFMLVAQKEVIFGGSEMVATVPHK